MPTITQLQYILAVQKNRHFGRAAEECHVSQPSLSAQIQKAEEELGVILFDRSKKPILTTEKGKKIIEQAKLILREHSKLYDLGTEEHLVAGNFHLGVIPTLSSYVVPLFIESFSKKYPKVSLRISEMKTQDIVRALHEDQLDAGLLVTPLHDSTITERKLFLEPFYVFASDDHELIRKKAVKDTELDANSVWLLEEGHCFRDQVIRVCSLRNKSQVLQNVSFESGSLETLIHIVRRGSGYTLLPHLATLELPEKEKKKNLKKFQKPVPTREVSLVYSRSFLKQAVMDALEEEITSHLPKELKNIKSSQIEVVEI
ncbi:MAG TPA: DNA-binding transcriptional regulator OxyR [Bdellovibrionales bacterium]|nr:DNA-binding transcriptional regulator OxyR [Pseudobdellovibrionaceae bacterium]HAG90362.1 DNA-binding transcriptional regulator OxyR [Bdellovibrionales bacterium]|tara:strand:- start:394 stop:1338 length:945 start_codon:yes stop_codon:yes gene_type:complete